MSQLLAVLAVLGILQSASPALAASGDEPAPPSEGVSAALKAPLFSPLFAHFPVATVDDEVIALDQLTDALASMHENAPGEAAAGKTDYKPVLDRLINTRLINLEAAEIGIDELPEVKASIKDYEGASKRELLKKRVTSGVKPDEKEVGRLYRDMVREWKIRSVIFDKEEDARKAGEEIKGGKAFDDAARQYIAAGKAKGGEEGQYVRADKLLPRIAGAVMKLGKGDISPVVKVDTGFVIITAEDVRYPDDPDAKAQAERRSLEGKRGEALKKYYGSLVKKYAKINKALLDSLDFEAKKPPIQDALKDKRALVDIKGGGPITVADFAATLEEKFFHGVERAAEEKKVNEQKTPTLDEMLYRRLFDKEAARRGLGNTDEYKDLLKQYKTRLIFSAFIQKAVVPDVKVNEAETKDYYEGHISDFTYPEMLKLSGIAFGKLPDAEAALSKLREGSEFKWVKENAEGRLSEDAPGVIVLSGETLSMKALPEDMQKALTGVKAGESRLYADREGRYYVLYVTEETPAVEQPYKEAREKVAKKLFNDKLNKSVADWTDKLRKAHRVRIFITGIGNTPE